jgi:hypothetical protein
MILARLIERIGNKNQNRKIEKLCQKSQHKVGSKEGMVSEEISTIKRS